MMATAQKPQKSKARADQIRALDRDRRAGRVTLMRLAQRVRWSKSTLSNMLAGEVPMTREDVQDIRAAIRELAR